MMAENGKLSKSMLLFVWFLGLLVLIGAGLAAGIIVFKEGLKVTNLTDLVPWGLWITIDLSSIALAGGAFSLCAVVYLVGLKHYEPVARTATFIGIIGYSMAMMCLLLDIGRPDRFYYGFIFWNTHSVLWEVTMCVGLYFGVLTVETLPIIGGTDWMKEKFPWFANKLTKIHHFAPVLAIFGLGLSMLHQSSLGATYGVIQAKPAWYRPSLSVLFIISAILGGISLTVFASMLSAKLTPRAKVNDKLLDKLSAAVGWGLIGYLYFRFWDTFSMTYTYQPGKTEALNMLTTGNLAVNFWFGEIIMGAVIPIFVLLNTRLRSNHTYRMAAFVMVVGGVAAYRWDVNMVGQTIVMSYLPHEIVARFTQYFPSWIEIISGAGIVAFGLLGFTIGVRHFRIVDHYRGKETIETTPEPLREAVHAGD